MDGVERVGEAVSTGAYVKRVVAIFICALLLLTAGFAYLQFHALVVARSDNELAKHFANQAHGFIGTGEKAVSAAELKQIHEGYVAARVTAFEKAEVTAQTRNWTQIASHFLSALALICSFGVALIGASKGILIDVQVDRLPAGKNKQEIAALAKKSGKSRKQLLFLIAISSVSVAGSDRLSAYSGTVAIETARIVREIERSDEKVFRALEAREIVAATTSLRSAMLQR